MKKEKQVSNFGRCNENAFGLPENPKESRQFSSSHFDKMEVNEIQTQDCSFVELLQADLF